MATKIARATQLIFGSTAGANQISEFGSLAAGTPMRYSGSTITPTLVQTLSNYLEGWLGAIVNGNAIAVEDLNALFYLITYQLAYGFQAGIPEWDAGTIYWTNSLAQSGGIIYQSIADDNVNEAVTNGTYWQVFSKVVKTPTIQTLVVGGSGTYTTPPGALYLKIRMVGGGGGGGGAAATSSSQSAFAGGAGGGDYLEHILVNPASSYSYSIGLGGPGGAAGNNVGTAGGTTSFGTSLLSVTGGDASSGAPASGSIGETVGTPGVGTFVGGNLLKIRGGNGGAGAWWTPGSGLALFGVGGVSYLSVPIISGFTNFIVGVISSSYLQAPGYGQGGSGGGSQNSSAGAGQQGGSGVIIVEEYYQ